MSKRLFALLILLCMVITLAGCNSSIRDTVESKETTLPPLRIDSTLTVKVTSINGNRLAVTVLEGNNNYDKDDALYVTYETVAKDQQVSHGTVITLNYNYVTDVTSYNGSPNINAGEITVIEDYKPTGAE